MGDISAKVGVQMSEHLTGLDWKPGRYSPVDRQVNFTSRGEGPVPFTLLPLDEDNNILETS